MTRRWNGKALIDEVARRVWDTSTGTSGFQQDLIAYANEIQDDLVSALPQREMKIGLKKLLPTQQEEINLDIDVPSAPTAAIGQTVTTLDYNSTTASDYTYDSDYIEFGATNATLTTADGATETFYANYTTDIDGWRGGGTLTGTAVGSAAVSGGKLDLSNSDLRYVTYAGASNFVSAQTGTVRYKVTPNHSGAPAANSWHFHLNQSSGSLVNLIGVVHIAGSGNLAPYIYNSSGSVITNSSFGAWSPTADQEYEIELDFDITTGATRLFIDGTQFGSTSTATGTRSTDVGAIAIGTDVPRTAVSRIKIDDFQYFTSVQHTANFTSEVPRVVGDYATGENKITLTSALTVGELYAFSANVNEPTSTNAQFILNVDGTDKYWDGSAWSTSDGTLAQSNTAATINTNAASLLSGSASIKVVVVFNNDSEGSRPSVTDVSVTDVGQLTTQASYKVYVTFLIYDEDSKKYIESEPSSASSVATVDLTDQSISVTSIPLFAGSSTVSPTTIYRRVYMAKLDSGETEYTEPFWVQDIEDNTTTTLTISADTTSTITPPSDSEVDQLTNDHLHVGSRFLNQVNGNKLRRYDADNSESSQLNLFSIEGQRHIKLFPKLSSGATDAQRTLEYSVYRRPHEVFYDVDRAIDLPIIAKKAFKQGIIARAYFHKDRSSMVTQENLYEQYKRELIKKLHRQIGKPSTIRDVNGDTEGREL